MKFWKSFSFFFIFPFTMTIVGFLGGIVFMNHFYSRAAQENQAPAVKEEGRAQPGPGEMASEDKTPEDTGGLEGTYAASTGEKDGNGADAEISSGNGRTEENIGGDIEENSDNVQEVSSFGEKLSADTVYVLEETNLRDQSVVETTWSLPEKYIGMNREQFLEAMDSYQMAPPLSELERGFVSLEVLSFSREKVVVRMNYQYVQPGGSFYLAVEDNYVVVYLEDKETVYMDTDILLTELPDDVQQDIINWMYVPDERELYNFLESYSS